MHVRILTPREPSKRLDDNSQSEIGHRQRSAGSKRKRDEHIVPSLPSTLSAPMSYEQPSLPRDSVEPKTPFATSRAPAFDWPSAHAITDSTEHAPVSQLYIPATDVGPLLNIRKNSVPGYISKYNSSMLQQMIVACPRSAGGIAHLQLNVLTIKGVERLIKSSRCKQADKVWAWIQQHVAKVETSRHVD